jgi:hypothetical protein
MVSCQNIGGTLEFKAIIHEPNPRYLFILARNTYSSIVRVAYLTKFEITLSQIFPHEAAATVLIPIIKPTNYHHQ